MASENRAQRNIGNSVHILNHQFLHDLVESCSSQLTKIRMVWVNLDVIHLHRVIHMTVMMRIVQKIIFLIIHWLIMNTSIQLEQLQSVCLNKGHARSQYWTR